MPVQGRFFALCPRARWNHFTPCGCTAWISAKLSSFHAVRPQAGFRPCVILSEAPKARSRRIPLGACRGRGCGPLHPRGILWLASLAQDDTGVARIPCQRWFNREQAALGGSSAGGGISCDRCARRIRRRLASGCPGKSASVSWASTCAIPCPRWIPRAG